MKCPSCRSRTIVQTKYKACVCIDCETWFFLSADDAEDFENYNLEKAYKLFNDAGVFKEMRAI